MGLLGLIFSNYYLHSHRFTLACDFPYEKPSHLEKEIPQANRA